MINKKRPKGFGFSPDDKCDILIDENCLGKDLDKPWQSAIEGLLKLDKAGHNITIFTSNEAKVKKFLADNYTMKEMMETHEKKMVEVEVMKEKEIDGVYKMVPVKIQKTEYPKVEKELERVAIFPRIIELIQSVDKGGNEMPLWFTRYGQISSMINTSNYRLIIVESNEEVIARIKGEESISKVADYTFESKLGSIGQIVPVQIHTDWKDVLEAIKTKPVSGDGMLKAPQSAYDEAKKKKEGKGD